MRVVAIDLGSRRIGVAVSDAGGVLAFPAGTIERRGRDRAADHRAIAGLAAEHGAERLVVGLPLSLDGSIGPAARSVLDEIDDLREVVAIPVETYDERLTTVTATRQLREGGIHEPRRIRAAVDQQAAAVLLQAWLDRTRQPPGTNP